MLHALMMYLRLRRLNGRTIGVARGGSGLVALRRATVTPLGIYGVALDEDETFFSWSRVEYVQWGPTTDRLVAAKLAALAAREKAGGETDDDDDDGSPFGAMLRAMKAARLASGAGEEKAPSPQPALSEEEIAAALAEDEKGLL